jgi:antibiotic biosynthesis monooxygenase (ABM) superfamily enzyme
MIARIWHGWAATKANADAYEAFLRTTFLPAPRKLAGYRGAEVLRRDSGAEIEFVTITRFDSLDSIRAFAGDDPERANVAPRARDLLSRWDARCSHFELAFTSEGADQS